MQTRNAMTNKYTCIHVTCVHICAKFELATTKTLACITVFRHTKIYDNFQSYRHDLA